MVNVSFEFVEKNLQNPLNHTKNAMQKVNCFTLRCFSYIIVGKKQGRSKFFSERELVLTMSIGNQISTIRTVVMIVGFVMIGIGWYKRAKSDKEVFKYMEERGQE